MKKRDRLTARSDFQRLLSGRRVFSGKSLVAFATNRPTAGGTRIGVSASRQIRGAVDRNRARRRLREAARGAFLGDGSMRGDSGITYDVVLIARLPALTVPFSRIQSDLGEFARRLGRPS